MDESMELRLLAVEAVVSALARRAVADPKFSHEVTAVLVELTVWLGADAAARANTLARELTGER